MMCASCFCSHLSPRQALAEALEQNSTLRDLNLELNNGIGSERLEAWCLGGVLGARVPSLQIPC